MKINYLATIKDLRKLPIILKFDLKEDYRYVKSMSGTMPR